MPLPDPSLPEIGTEVDTPGSEIITDQPNKTLPIIDSLVKAAEDITNAEIEATNGLVKIAQLRAKAMTMPVLIEFAKGLFQERYDNIPASLEKDIAEYMEKIGDGTKELTRLEAVYAYGLEIHVKVEALRNLAAVVEPNLGRDAVNWLKIFGLL